MSNAFPENIPMCHIYAQTMWHSPVSLWGDRRSLELIREAITRALETGQDAQSKSLFTSDGEGYHVEVKIRDHNYLEGERLPYTASFANGVWEPAD